MSKIMGREIDIAYDRDQRMGFFRDNELSFTVDGSGITDEDLAEILGGTILVRCQDCEYFRQREGASLCGERNGMISPAPEDFCSRGRRKRDDQTTD